MPDSPPRKVLLIGWDAADWNVALPLIEQGKMPALKRQISYFYKIGNSTAKVSRVLTLPSGLTI